MDKDYNKLLSQGISTSTTPKNDGNILIVEHPIVSKIELPISTNDSLSSYTISLYVLRQADLNDTRTIQAIFDNGMKYIFKALESLVGPKVSLVNVVDVKHSHFYLE
jgi:F420-0:gamma-glutamyl ligase